MRELEGIGASSGLAIAPAYCLIEPNLIFDPKGVHDTEIEMERLKQSISSTKKQLKLIYDSTKQYMGEQKATIIAAQELVLEDPAWLTAISDQIKLGNNAEMALTKVADVYATTFAEMENDYMKERVADIRDVAKRMLSNLIGVNLPDLSLIQSEVILVADDLVPSLTVQLNKQYIKGIVTNVGGKTSHSAILARSLDIPAVVGTKKGTIDIKHGIPLIVDGEMGRVIIDPVDDIKRFYLNKQKVLVEGGKSLRHYLSVPSTTADGHTVHIVGNIGNTHDIDAVLAHGGEGVGLFRTEFLYMNRSGLPTEEEQFDVYRTVLLKMQNKPTVVRTMDIGGDKGLSYLGLPKESNPFLGYRAIRISLGRQHIFRTQLRALLKASVHGYLKIMFPMISILEEFRLAKSILLEEKQKLLNAGIPVSEKIEIGMMVETPAAAMVADFFVQEADFFSIGTNDLIQYMFAADRMNEQVSYLYQPYHPAILRAIQIVVEAAHKKGKWVGICGEMAGDQIAIPLLLGLGIDEFSMNPSAILRARSQITKLNKEELSEHLKHILTLATDKEVSQYVKEHLL
ncbi:phosphoenolpyruvate--protein phosphotransferase [Psychrobacillus sp. FSL K6-4046]|uniref:phosphoenolpyruvate--protein phosphotransferase n=1 Tax=Psychrobacillus sp. FSL K6-4046 TaxID=2921550 RepID=UPI00315AE94E